MPCKRAESTPNALWAFPATKAGRAGGFGPLDLQAREHPSAGRSQRDKDATGGDSVFALVEGATIMQDCDRLRYCPRARADYRRSCRVPSHGPPHGQWFSLLARTIPRQTARRVIWHACLSHSGDYSDRRNLSSNFPFQRRPLAIPGRPFKGNASFRYYGSMTIAPTINLSEAAGCLWDVVVVGAGPAGSLAARELARLGAHVLLVDRSWFPRFKVCGCCLNLRALSALTALGLGDLPDRRGAVRLQGVRLAAGGLQARLDLPGGMALSRAAFDTALVEAAIAAGVAFLPATHATLGPVTAFSRQLLLRQDGREVTIEARLVLAADGLAGRFLGREAVVRVAAASRLGAGVIAADGPASYEAGAIFLACGTGGYVGLVRLEDGRLNLAAAFDPRWVKEANGCGKAAASILEEAGLPAVERLAELPWRGTPLLTRRAVRPWAERVLVLGDAAGYVEPFTGEGMAMALEEAAAVAPLAWQACREWRPAWGRRWSLIHRRLVARRHRVCRGVASALRRPGLMRLVVSLLDRFPGLASPLVRYLNAPGPARAGRPFLAGQTGLDKMMGCGRTSVPATGHVLPVPGNSDPGSFS
jgi:flavin-dependent dehydrogenase